MKKRNEYKNIPFNTIYFFNFRIIKIIIFKKQIMIRLYYLFFAFFFYSQISYSQIIYNYDDYAIENDEFIFSVDTVLEDVNFVNLQGGDWDLTGLNENFKDTIFFKSPSEYPELANEFPNANLVLERSDNSLVFLNKTNNKVELLNADFADLGFNLPPSDIPEGIFGYTSLSAPLKVLDFPMTYESSFYGELNESFALANTFDFLDTLSFEIGGITITGENIDSIRFSISMNSTHTIDDFGNLILPIGQFETIRKRTERTFNVTFGMGIQIIGFFQWIDIPQEMIPNSEYTVTVYNWYAKGIGVPIAKAMVKPELNIEEPQNKEVDLGFSSISYLKLLPTSSEKTFYVDKNIKIYPNPAREKIFIEKNINANLIEIYDIYGKNILRKKINNENFISLSEMTNGIYFYKIFDKKMNKISSSKFLIQK